MSNAQTITGRVIYTKRAGTSRYGNPSYDATIRITRIEGTPVEVSHESLATVTLRTSSNVGIAYGIGNPEYRDHDHEYMLTRAGRITSARRV